MSDELQTQKPLPPSPADWPARLREMDRDLKKRGLVVPDAREWLSFEKNVAARMYASRFHFRFPRTRDLITTAEEFSGLLFRVGVNSKIETRTLGDRLTDLSASKISDIFAVSPVDLKDSHLHALLAKGYFGTPFDEPLPNYDTKSVPEYFESKPLPKRIRKKTPPYDPKLAVIAFLITRQLVTEDLVETYLPEIPYREFHRYQSKIHREIETTFPERFKRFEKYWDSLTTPQKQALRQVHMAQDRASTYPEAAKALGITTNALKERLKAATAKLKAFYPELRAIQDESKRPSPWKPSDYDTLKMFHLARARTPLPVTRLDPVTRAPLEILKHPRTKIRTPVPNLREKIAEWERGRYDPDHNGVGSPRLAHMTAIPPPRTSAVLNPENQKITQARIRHWEETGESISASECARLARR